MRWNGVVLAGIALAWTGWSSTAAAVEFEPFSEVENVCPDCNRGNADIVKLTDQRTFSCEIVAENDDFLVAVRFGEVRAVPHAKVLSVEWSGGDEPDGLRDEDQVVLKNGHVLTGEIVEEKSEPPLFQVESSVNGYSYVVFKEQIDALYRGGELKEVTIEESSGDDEEGGETGGRGSSDGASEGEPSGTSSGASGESGDEGAAGDSSTSGGGDGGEEASGGRADESSTDRSSADSSSGEATGDQSDGADESTETSSEGGSEPEPESGSEGGESAGSGSTGG